MIAKEGKRMAKSLAQEDNAMAMGLMLIDSNEVNRDCIVFENQCRVLYSYRVADSRYEVKPSLFSTEARDLIMPPN